jgi:hypothetical protein
MATGIDPLKVARKLWKHTRVNEGRIRRNQLAQGAPSDRPLGLPDLNIKAPS